MYILEGFHTRRPYIHTYIHTYIHKSMIFISPLLYRTFQLGRSCFFFFSKVRTKNGNRKRKSGGKLELDWTEEKFITHHDQSSSFLTATLLNQDRPAPSPFLQNKNTLPACLSISPLSNQGEGQPTNEQGP